MARVIHEFPAEKPKSLYPWDDWGNGEIWELVQGEDYTVQSSSMRQRANKAASARGKSVVSKFMPGNPKARPPIPDKLLIQFVPKRRPRPSG